MTTGQPSCGSHPSHYFHNFYCIFIYLSMLWFFYYFYDPTATTLATPKDVNLIVSLHGHQNAVQPLPFSPPHDALGLDPTIDPMLCPILSKSGLSHHAVGRPVTAASHYDILFSHGQSVSGMPQIQQQALVGCQQAQVTLPPPPSHPTVYTTINFQPIRGRDHMHRLHGLSLCCHTFPNCLNTHTPFSGN